MLGKIMKATVEKLEPGSGWLWDKTLVGFGVRNQLRCAHYALRYRFGGKQRVLTIGPHGKFTVETARREFEIALDL